MRGIWLATLLVLVSAPVQGRADPRTEALSRYFEAQAADGGLNGNVLVAERGRALYQRSFGMADFGTGRPNTPSTEFEMASIAKVFTGVAILQLVEQHRIGLDQPLSSYMPAFPYRGITIRQLLSHSSGLGETEIDIPAFEKANGRRLEMADLVPAIVATGVAPKLKPGERWWYSNLGYQLLARLVEERSGERFDRYLDRHILRPAGMTHTYLKTETINRADTPAFAQNYQFPFRFSLTRTRLAGTSGYYNERRYGSASVVSTTGDMLLLDRALRGRRLLRPETLSLAYTAQRLADGSPVFVWIGIGGMGDADDALGWFRFRDTTYGRIVWHTGGMPGCLTMFMRNLDTGQTVIVLDNVGSERLYQKAMSAMLILNGRHPLPTPRSLARIYARLLVSQGEDAAFSALLLHKDDPVHYSVEVDDLNNLGYELADHGHLPQALAAFRTALALWPRNDNLFESYGEMLARVGRREDAEAMFRRSLALNPANADAKSRLDASSGP